VRVLVSPVARCEIISTLDVTLSNDHLRDEREGFLPLPWFYARHCFSASSPVVAGFWRSMRSASGVSPGMAPNAYVIRRGRPLSHRLRVCSPALPEDAGSAAPGTTPTEPAFAITQGTVLIAFIVLGSPQQSDLHGGAIVDGQRSTAHEKLAGPCPTGLTRPCTW